MYNERINSKVLKRKGTPCFGFLMEEKLSIEEKDKTMGTYQSQHAIVHRTGNVKGAKKLPSGRARRIAAILGLVALLVVMPKAWAADTEAGQPEDVLRAT